MYEVKFYPLVDMDSGGTEKVPMFGGAISEDGAQRHDLCLMEVVSHHYCLCSKAPLTRDADSGWNIHCPLCGQVMRPISTPASACSRSLYRCPKCGKPTKNKEETL